MSDPRPRALSLALLLAALAGPARAAVVSLPALERQLQGDAGRFAPARARLDGAAAKVDLAGAPLRPTLGAGAELEALPGSRLVRVEDVNGDPYLVQGARAFGDPGVLLPYPRYGASLTATARLWDFGRTDAAVDSAEADREALRAGARAERTEAVLELRRAYAAWLLSAVTREALAEGVAGARLVRQRAEARVAEGAAVPATVLAASESEARLGLDLARAEASVARARGAVERALLAPLPADATPDAALLDVSPPGGAPTEDARIGALARERDAALAAGRKSDRARAPVLAATGDAGVRGQQTSLFPTYRAGISLEVPLLDGGAASAGGDVARARAAELGALARNATLRARREEAAVRAELAALDAAIAGARALVTAAEARLASAEAGLSAGAALVEGVVEARARVTSARVDLLALRVERATAVLRLLPVERAP